MRMNQALSIIFLLCLAIPLSSAEPANIVLKSPAGGITTESFSLDFIFSFDKYAEIENCSLIVDGSFKALRNTMITIENNKMGAILTAGEHTWNIICYDNEGNRIESEERNLKISTGGVVKTGYETIYNNNGLRSYLIQIAEGKAPVELPAMKLSEDIRIKTSQKTHYIDVLRMGSDGGTFFVEVRDRSNSKIHRFLVGESVLLDFDNDKTVDISLKLKSIERNANAYFIVSSYPSAEAIPETQPAEQPAKETENETMPESEIDDVIDEVPATELENNHIDDKEVTSEHVKVPQTTILLIAAIIILVIIIALIVIIKNKQKRPSKVKKEKSMIKAKKEIESKAKPVEKEEKEPDDEPSDEPIKDDDENFEVITSVGKKRR